LKKGCFDKALLVMALAVVVCAFAVVPRGEIRLFTIHLGLGIKSGGLVEKQDIKTITDEFQADNPGIKVKPEDFSPGAACDMVAFNSGDAAFYRGGIAGDVYPVVSYINIFFYNIGLLREAGFNRPPKTRTELLELCGKLKEMGKISIGFSQNAVLSLLPWFYQGCVRRESGGNMESPESESGESGNGENGRIYIDWDSKEVIETFEFLNTLNKEGCIKPESLDQSEAALLEDFISGRCAMMTAPVSYAGKIKKSGRKVNFSISTIPAPQKPGGRPALNLSSWNIVISGKSRHREEALALIKYFEEKRFQLKVMTFAVPGNPGGFFENGGEDLPEVPEDPLLKKAQDIYEACEIIEETRLFRDPFSVAGTLKKEVKMMWAGARTPVAAGEAMKSSGAL